MPTHQPAKPGPHLAARVIAAIYAEIDSQAYNQDFDGSSCLIDGNVDLRRIAQAAIDATAAPDLLAVCQTLVADWADEPFAVPDVVLAARAAIASARGG
jgi:hypothetical protein